MELPELAWWKDSSFESIIGIPEGFTELIFARKALRTALHFFGCRVELEIGIGVVVGVGTGIFHVSGL